MFSIFSSNRKQIFAALVLVAVICGTYRYIHDAQIGNQEKNNYPEVLQVQEDMDLQTLGNFFKKLAEEKGGVYAYEVLKRAKVGQNINVHLLGHVIGDVLYTQKGIDAMANCTTDFRNACSHSVVSQLFLDEGERALDIAADVCRKAPGGLGAYNLCFHGLGHGVLAYTQFDMPEAVKICKQIDARLGASFANEMEECIGGAVMEIIGGGNHDKEKWTEQRAKYLHPDNPLGLCQADFMPSEARPMCYTYVTPYLFDVVGMNFYNPTNEKIAASMKFCDALPDSDEQNKTKCYSGFGKEFVTMVMGNDVREDTFKNISDELLIKTRDWCILATTEMGRVLCVTGAVGSLYWGGVNDPNDAFRFCQISSSVSGGAEHACLSTLYTNMRYLKIDTSYRFSFCAGIPEEYRNTCRSNLGI